MNTGVWSKKAIAEAKLWGEVEVIASSEDRNFTYYPKGSRFLPMSIIAYYIE